MEYRKSYLICSICGKRFYNKGNNGERKYCSKKCSVVGRKTGKIVQCKNCGEDIYKRNSHLKNTNLFCSKVCADKYSGRNKIKFVCKICGSTFGLSKSVVDGRKFDIKYCSIECRNNDKEQMLANSIKGNLAQQNKHGLNKLELSGKRILDDLKINYEEQVLMFNKFLVDVLIEEKKFIIQWDGIYWHTKPKRMFLDKSQDVYFKKCGYNVLRITDKEIKEDINEVYNKIKLAYLESG
jgi:very-short-patch-repair endonuclease